jgi:hypothetical protein
MRIDPMRIDPYHGPIDIHPQGPESDDELDTGSAAQRPPRALSAIGQYSHRGQRRGVIALTVRAEFNDVAAQWLRTVLQAHDAFEPRAPHILALPNLDLPHDAPVLRISMALTIALNTVSANMALRRRAQWEDQRQRLSTWLHDLEKMNHLTEDNAVLSTAKLAGKAHYSKRPRTTFRCSGADCQGCRNHARSDPGGLAI